MNEKENIIKALKAIIQEIEKPVIIEHAHITSPIRKFNDGLTSDSIEFTLSIKYKQCYEKKNKK